MKYYLCLLLLIISGQLSAQLPETPLETIVESAAENADPEEVVQQLVYYRQHPININTASVEELTTPGLFDQLQTAAILQHRKRYGMFIAFEELQAIPGLSTTTLQRIRNFCCIKPVINTEEWKPGNLFANGKHMVLLRSRRLIGAEMNPGYAGDNYGQSFAWRYTSGTHLDVGFNGDKDPGEAYFSKGKLPLMDSWNYHVFLRPGGKFRALALGDFQLNCGQGLVVWTGFAGTKGPDVLNVRKLGPVLRPYSAFGEYGNYRGIAFSIGSDKIVLTSWFSNKQHDSDLEGNYFHTINSSGYHRTESEITSRSNLKRTLMGFNLKLKGKSFQQEITVQRTRYDAFQQKGIQPYQRFESEGNTALHTGYAYAYQFRNFIFAGELAADQDFRFASINTILVSVDPRLAFSVLHRQLTPGYFSLTSDPFRENSQPVNEQGIYGGLQWQIFPKIKLSAFTDYFHFPWLRYQSDRPSEGNEWLVQSTWVPSRNSELYLRFRKQVKEENLAGDYTGLAVLQEVRKCNLRGDARLKLSRDIFFQARAEWTRIQNENEAVNHGWLVFQEIDLRPMGKALNFTLRYSVFTTGSYDSRIYAFEQELPGSYSLPAYSGSGTSAYFLVRWKVIKGLDAWFRLGTEKSTASEVVRTWSPGVQLRWIFG